MNDKKLGGNKPFPFINMQSSTILVVLVILYFFIITSYIFYNFSSNPGTCFRCHLLRPSVESFKKSTHSNFGCYICHSKAGVVGDIAGRLSLFRETYIYFRGEYKKPLNPRGELYKKIEDRNCEKCHSPMRPVTARNGIVINHKVHKENNIQCSQCHNRIAHPLDITSRYLKTEKISSKAPYKDGAAMISCMKCHTGSAKNPPDECLICHTEDFRVPANCRICHGHETEKLKPESHNTEGYAKSDHEPLAKSKPEYCLRCHQKVFCDECHQMSGLKISILRKEKIIFHPPGSHFKLDFFPPIHGDEAKQRGKEYCYQCHKEKMCSDCHGIEMPHPGNYLKTHGKVVKEETFEKRCQGCHENRNVFCESGCHHRGWNPALGPLKETHSQVVALNGIEYCYNCHTPVFCAVCHVSGIKKDMFVK